MENEMELSKLKETIEFVIKHKYLYEVPNFEFFTKNVLHTIDSEWKIYLSSLRFDQLNVLPLKFQEFKVCLASSCFFFQLYVKSYLTHYYKSDETLSYTQLSEVDDIDNDEKLGIKQVKAKKSHEMRLFYRFLKRECQRASIDRVVDVGCGLGHLLRYLHDMATDDNWLPECVGVEADQDLCCGAANKCGDIVILNIKFVYGDVGCRDAIIGKTSKRTALISLHGCGDLQASLLREFVEAEKIPLLMTVGCCYHKIRDVEKNWPMSETLKGLLPVELHRPPPSFFRLACQERLSRWVNFTEPEHNSHQQAFVNRALSECVYETVGNVPKGCKRPTNRQLGSNVAEFRHKLLKRNRVESADEIARWNMALDEVLQRFDSDFEMVEPFTALQFAMQGPLETLILVDRLLFLRENSIDAELVPIFQSKISPRNMCIIGRR